MYNIGIRMVMKFEKKKENAQKDFCNGNFCCAQKQWVKFDFETIEIETNS